MSLISLIAPEVFAGPLGTLNVVSNAASFPFSIQRVFWISAVPKGATRGYHAHKTGQQIIFCVSGKVSLAFDDGRAAESVVLEPGGKGAWMKEMVWGEQTFLEENTILLVFASNEFLEDDYVRDKLEFYRLCQKVK